MKYVPYDEVISRVNHMMRRVQVREKSEEVCKEKIHTLISVKVMLESLDFIDVFKDSNGEYKIEKEITKDDGIRGTFETEERD